MKLFLRDVSIKCKKVRRSNLATGTLRRSTGIIPISVRGTEMDKYIRDNGFNKVIDIELEGECLKAKILRTKKDLILHNIINVDFQEI